MSNHWDVVIVGAGVGGLTAAAELVKAGLRILVLERNLHPGGTAYVYRRKGFTFPMGPLGFSHPKLVREILRGLGETDDLEFFRVHYRIRAFNMDLPISLSFTEMKEEFPRFFPSEAKGLKQFFEGMEEMISSASSPTMEKSSKISASEYLHGLIKDWRLRHILGSLGTREPYSNLSLLAAMWNLMCQEGIWYPKGGMQSFCERLAKAVTGNPGGAGEIRMGMEVREIRVKESRVLGVTLMDGTEMESASVISNADYKTTFLKLIEPKGVPPEWGRAISQARQTGSVFQVCLGVEKEKVDLSVFNKARRLIYRQQKEDFTRKENPDGDVLEAHPEALASQELEVSLWNGEGDKPAIVIRTDADYSHFAKYKIRSGLRSSHYQAYKTKLARAIVREIGPLLPGLENSTFVMDIATPLTFEDQGGRSGGAIAGWSWDYEDFQDHQPKELIKTPIKGLYMAGYQAFSALFMGGVPTAMESGKRAAQAVLQRALPIEKIIIPGVHTENERRPDGSR